MPRDFDVIELLIRVPVILLALTVHEFSHAYFALRMGDPTAYRLGRCSLNPLRHLDPLGTICLMFAPIGWAKPVPVNPLNFHDARKGDIIVSVAGPLSNAAQAILFALLLRGLIAWGPSLATGEQSLRFERVVGWMLTLGVEINVGLAVFNMLPLYPLDGFHVSLQLMRPEAQERYLQFAMLGPFVVLGLVMLGRVSQFDPITHLIQPPLDFVLHYVAGIGLA